MREDFSTDAEACVRNAIGALTQAQDGVDASAVVAKYTEDAVLELPGTDPIVGREALLGAFEQWVPKAPQLHLVGNTVVTVVSADEATASSDVTFHGRTEQGWTVQIVGHYEDMFRLVDGSWLVARRAATYS